jgi:outer membrane protein assembly factor BamB
VATRPNTGVLTCLSAADGKVIWGGDQPVATALGGGWNFISDPLISDDNIYITAVSLSPAAPDLHLLTLSLEDGKVLKDLILGRTAPTQSARGIQPAPRSILRLVGDTLYVATNSGALVSTDLPANRVNWVFTYDTLLPAVRTLYPFGGSPDSLEFPSAILISGSTLYLKERINNMVFALDLAGPSLKWKRQVDRDSTIMAVDDSAIYLFGKELSCVDLATREMRWSTRIPLSSSTIEPFVIGARALIYSSQDIYDVDLKTGRRDVWKTDEKGVIGGAMLWLGDRMISVSNRAVSAYPLALPPESAGRAVKAPLND